MPFSLNGTPLQKADLLVERAGVWEGKATTAGVLDLPVGSAVVLEIGDMSGPKAWKGYVVAGGTFPGASTSTYTLAGGAAGWSRVVSAKGYQVPTGVSLAMVAAQLAAAAGEKIDLAGQDKILGDHWTRPAGPASVALSALFPLETGGWRVDPDGFARPGARPPAPVPPSVRLLVEDQRRGDRWARLALPDDAVSAALPGAIITADNLAAPIVVATTEIHASSESVTVEVRGEGGTVELLVAIVQALTTQARVFNGVWTYQVADADTGRPNLRALSTVPGLPATLACDKVPGLPGATSTLDPTALVLLGFRDGSPARPFVALYLPGVLPASVTLDAATLLTLGAGATSFAGLATPTDANFQLIASTIASAPVIPAGFIAALKGALGSFPSVAATKVKVQ